MNKKLRETIKNKRNLLAIRVAKHYANVSCPLITYQEKLPDEVKKLRKQ